MPLKDTPYLDTKALLARRIAEFVGALILAAWCISLYLPKTIFERAVSSIVLLPLYFAGITAFGAQLSNVLQAAIMRYSPVPILIGMVVFGLLAWRCRALHALTTGSRSVKLVSGALLAFGMMITFDFLSSNAGSFQYGDQAQRLLFVGFALAFGMKANKNWWRFLIGIILACIVTQSVYAIVIYHNGIDVFESPGIGFRAAGTLYDPLVFYPIALMGILMLIPMALGENRLFLRLVYWLSVAVVVTALLLTFTRAAGMGLAAGLIWLVWKRRENKWLKMLTALSLIVMVATMLARATTKEGSFGMDRSALGRVQIWRMSLNIIRDNWLWGVGYNGYRDVQTRYIDSKAKGINYTNYDPLNQALAMTANHGVFGAGVFILFIYAVWAAYKSGKKEEYAPWEWRMKQGIAAAGIGILVAGLVDTPLYSIDRYPGTFMLLVCMGFLLHLEVRDHPPTGKWRYAKAFRRVSLSVLALAVIGIGYVITFGLVDAHRTSKAFDAKLAQARSVPGFVSVKNIPKAMQDCVIAEEDLYFNLHHGYSLVDMHRALRVNIRAGRVKQGGSTVTQQLGKNLFFSRDRTPRRKIAEIIVAVKLEKELSKKEILETYLNTIEYGLGSRGIDQAAHAYFGKDASKLTDAECALLTGFIPSPPKKELTPVHARSAIHLTLSRLKHANPSRWISVQDELDQAGENAWLKNHIRSRKQE